MILPLECLICLSSLRSLPLRRFFVVEDVAFTVGADAVQLAVSQLEEARDIVPPFYFGDLTFSRLDWFATAAAILSFLLQHTRVLDALVQTVLHPRHLVFGDACRIELLVHLHLELFKLLGAHVVGQNYAHALLCRISGFGC